MKTIGLLGGMSWESTALYYRLINEDIRARLGGLHSAKIALLSVDFHAIEALQANDDWAAAADALATSARQVEAAGAECLLICTNTMHLVAPAVAEAISIPLLHLADATAQQIRVDGVDCVGLLGTRFTMEKDFYRERLEAQGLTVLTPDEDARRLVNDVIYNELCLGDLRDSSRAAFLEIIESLRARGAEAVIEGCTEIGLLVTPADTTMKLYDTTLIHAKAAVDFSLDNG
ncbi:MAG: aspartate/glutamate racemase family protein [Pseudomonadota bacterium]